jgi:hypothetical protein
VVRVEGRLVEFEDYFGKVRTFPLGRGFLLEGKPVELVAPKAAPAGQLRRRPDRSP